MNPYTLHAKNPGGVAPSAGRWLLKALRPFWPQVALSVLVGAAAIAGGIGLLGTSAWLIATAALHPSIAALQVAIVGVRFFGLTRGGFRYLERLISHDLNFRLLARLRVAFYAALEPLAPAHLWRGRSGDLLNRAIADIETLQEFYIRAVAPPLTALIVVTGYCAFVGTFAPAVALLLTAIFIVSGIALPFLLYRLGLKPGARLLAARAELAAGTVDGVQGMADLLAFNQEEAYLQRLRKARTELNAAQAAQTRLTAWHEALAVWLPALTITLTLILAIPAVRAGRLDGVMLAVLALSIPAVFEATAPLLQAAQQLGSSLAAAQRLLDWMEIPPAVIEPPAMPPLPLTPNHPPELRVRNLTFRYAPDLPPALENIDFTLQPGKQITLVGPSGAGKSTLVHLLLRFWDYSDGEIELGGRPLREYDRAALSRLIGVVSQSTYLFAGTIRENLRLARPEADDAALIAAAQRAQLHEFILGLPDGYDTWIGESGLRLSGGERQRLAVARALLQDAPLLILDEATANLDPGTERQLLQALEPLTAGRSTIRITHRLVGLESQDEILVLKNGRIVERGTQAELMEQQGFYARLRKT